MISELDWYQIKLFIQHAGGISMNTLHVLIAIPLQLAAGLIFRAPLTRWLPWLAILALALANELGDLRVEQWPDPGMQYGEAAKDIILTMLLPTLILGIARLKPQLLVGQLDRAAPSE